jgi:hypothetical protein
LSVVSSSDSTAALSSSDSNSLAHHALHQIKFKHIEAKSFKLKTNKRAKNLLHGFEQGPVEVQSDEEETPSRSSSLG